MFDKELKLELVALRCYSCNHEFAKQMKAEDKFTEIECPSCTKVTCEINYGKKV